MNKLDGTSFNRNDQNLFEVCPSLNPFIKIATYNHVDLAKFWRDFQTLSLVVAAGQKCLTNVLLLLQAFAIFCGMAIHNTVMYENVNKAMAKQKVALEVRNFFQKLKDFFQLLCCFVNARLGVLMVSALSARLSGPGTLCCLAVGQEIKLSQCLSPPRCMNGQWRI